MSPVRHALNQYRQTNLDAGAAYADPHTLVSMLFEAVQERLAVAKGAIARQDFATKGRVLGNAMDILGYLQACLDKDRGGEIAANLDALYTYMISCLFKASSRNDPRLLDEVGALVKEIESGWVAIRALANKQPNQEMPLLGER